MSTVERPHSAYVFAVLSLTAFLALFTIFRSPGIAYQVQAALHCLETTGDHRATGRAAELKARLLASESVLQAMRSAELIAGEPSPGLLEIAQRISERIDVRTAETDEGLSFRVALVSERPQAAQKLLDALTDGLTRQSAGDYRLTAEPAAIVQQRGGSVSVARLMPILVGSLLFGVLGVRLNRTPAKPGSAQDQREIAGIPVLVDFGAPEERSSRHAGTPAQRSLRLLLGAGELAVAAAFALVAFHLATRDALAGRFMHDPFAACGEIITHVVG